MKLTNKLPYQELWFTLDQFKEDINFGKPFLTVVPKKWKNEFSTVTELYETIILDFQSSINLYFNRFFEHVKLEILPLAIQELIKGALYNSFSSKLYGVLFPKKNVRTSFSTGSGYSIQQEFLNETGSYLDKFTPESLKALVATGIKQLMDQYNNDWEIVLVKLGELNYDSIYTKKEIDELLEILRIDTETMIKTIANWIEERLQIFTEELPKDTDFIDKVAEKVENNEGTIEQIKNKLKADEEFKDDLGNNISENPKFIVTAGDKIANDDPFLSKVANKIAPTVVTQKYVDDQDNVTLTNAKNYVDNLKADEITPFQAFRKLSDNEPSFAYLGSKEIQMNRKTISNIGDPLMEYDVASKIYVDDKFNSIKPWIVGEYKWMKFGSTMPTGWVKTAIKQGFSLVSGETAGETAGEIKLHNHSTSWTGNIAKSSSSIGNTLGGSGSQHVPMSSGGGSTDWSTLSSISVSSTGGSNNLPAGIYAELWEYNPTLYAEIIAMGLTPHEYAEQEKVKIGEKND